MRERLPNLRPTVLVLTLTALLAVPAAVAAQSGPQPTIAMQPASAAPGTPVEIAGLEFPAETDVTLRLNTPTGTFELATTATGRDGTFRQLVVLPSLPVGGAWAVEAWSADGSAASHAFEATAPAPARLDATAVAQGRTVPADPVAGDGAASDGVFLVIIGCLLGMVSTGALYAWRVLHDERVQPGMSRAEDLIWSDGQEDEAAEPTATSEPFWLATPREVDSAAQEVESAAREIAGSGEHEAAASA